MLLQGFFRVRPYNPKIVQEVWTLVDNITAAGPYYKQLDWGKYKIVISGGGGSGGAGSATHSDYRNYARDGSAGQQLETVISVERKATKTLTGIIATGAASSYAYAQKGKGTYDPMTQTTKYTPVYTVTAGEPGTGYASGTKGSTNGGKGQASDDSSGASGGSGGGSTSLSVDNVLTLLAKGGNGGIGSADEIGESAAGIGGSGGVSSGTGAAGGKGVFGYKQAATSGAGANGYVKIYKSNIFPR